MKILLVEDDELQGASLKLLLEVAGHEVVWCVVPSEVDAKLRELIPDALLIDYRLPGECGVELWRRLRRDTAAAGCPAVLVTASSIEEVERLKLEVTGEPIQVLRKPFTLEELMAALGVKS